MKKRDGYISNSINFFAIKIIDGNCAIFCIEFEKNIIVTTKYVKLLANIKIIFLVRPITILVLPAIFKMKTKSESSFKNPESVIMTLLIII